MTFVPNASQAFVPAGKLTYLLVNDAGKARFFRRFGFDVSRSHELEDSLVWHVRNHHYVTDMPTANGHKYTLRCSAPSPDGRNPCIVTVWVIEVGETSPRLVTAYAG